MIITADLHFGLDVGKYNVPTIKGESRKLLDSVKLLKEMIEAARQDDSILIICGDIFDSSNPHILAIDSFVYCMSYADMYGVDVYILAGNHDCLSKFSCLDFLFNLSNVHIMAKEFIKVQRKDDKDLILHFRDHLSTLGNIYGNEIPVAVEYNTSPYNIHILFSHAIIAGISKDDKEKYESYEHGNVAIYDPNRNVTMSRAKNFFKYVFLGHLHEHHSVQFDLQEIIYPGSPIICDFGEKNHLKGYIKLDKETLKWEFVSFKFQQQKHIEVIIPWEDKWNFSVHFENNLQDLKDVRSKVTVTTKSYSSVDQVFIKECMMQIGFVSFFEVIETKLQRSEVSPKVSKGKIVDHKQLFIEWINKQQELAANKQLTQEIGLSIIEEVESVTKNKTN